MSKRKMIFENLETRQLMAGDVTASVSGGSLYINEAPGQIGLNNGVFVSQLANGKIRVSGDFSPDGMGVSKVNGLVSQDFAVTGNLIVRLGAGSDSITVGGPIAPTFNDVNIDVGAQALVVAKAAVTGMPGSVFTPIDNDEVHIESVRTRGSMSVNTGPGTDYVFMSKFNIGSAPNGHNGDLSINTGAGVDDVFLQTSSGSTISNVFGKINIQTYSSLNENDSDNVSLQTILALGDVLVQTGGGSDVIHMTSVTSNKKIDINAGTGDDSATLRKTHTVDGLFARMGDGNDNLFVDTVWGRASLMGEGGNDTLNHSNLKGSGNSITGWEWINGRRVIGEVVKFPLASKVL